MHTLTYELRTLAQTHREGSYGTQAQRRNQLTEMGDILWTLGYKDLHASDLKGRHITALLQYWRDAGLATGTLKNHMAALRWWATHIGKPTLLHPSNAYYGIPHRRYIATTSKAQEVPRDVLARVRNQYVQHSLALQRAFGLRREEAIKIRLVQADHGDHLGLKGSWCKGGQPREVPIRTPQQRTLLERIKAWLPAQASALIPPHKTYAQQLHSYEAQCRRVGLHKMHGLRHAYAQERYQELTGHACPVAGGPPQATLSGPEREADYDARLVISAELGHGREEITTTYLGR